MESKNQSLPEISADIKRTWQRTRRDHSAGGVVYRYADETNAVEIALIATRGATRWQLPKGSREQDESSVETAIREVQEEVGLDTVEKRFLQTIDYWYWDTFRKEVPELVHKSVDFYLLQVVGGTLSDACYEVDAAGWFPIANALQILTFQGELEVVRLAAQALRVSIEE